MRKVYILIEAERYENCPHPEVGQGNLPNGWKILPIDSSLWLNKIIRKRCQKQLSAAAKAVREAQEINHVH